MEAEDDRESEKNVDITITSDRSKRYNGPASNLLGREEEVTKLKGGGVAESRKVQCTR
jgi:hypothetical protein